MGRGGETSYLIRLLLQEGQEWFQSVAELGDWSRGARMVSRGTFDTI